MLIFSGQTDTLEAMRNTNGFGERTLESLFEQTSVSVLSDRDRMVVFSDLHMGDGGNRDDFLTNSNLFLHAIGDYYLPRADTLILNGDIEELQRFRLRDILRRWELVYDLFNRFESAGRLKRLIGNHDMSLAYTTDHDFTVLNALRFEYKGNTLFIFHGHQTVRAFERYNRLVELGLRYVANPLGIGNYSVAYSNAKRFRSEMRAYGFAAANRLVAVMGHTHRPLFESMSKVDSLKFEIERLCRIYPDLAAGDRERVEHSIRSHKDELTRIRQQDDRRAATASLYNSSFLVPCTFNSGTVIGHRGMTCLEIGDGRIALVHWFDETRSQKYLEYADYETEPLTGTPFHRVVLKSERLDYIFTRVRLLAGS